MKPHSRKSKTSRHVDKSICTQAHIELARTIPQRIINSYRNSISSGINKFISHHNTKIQHLLDTSSQLKPLPLITKTPHTAHPNVGCQHLNLANDTEAAAFRIPSFIDIFRHLATLPIITKQLTHDELAELSRILALPEKHAIYQSLHHSPVGNRLADIYASVGHQINLTQKFPTTDFHSLLFNSFTSYTILEMIESHMNHVSICTLSYKGKKYPNFLYIYHHGRSKVSRSSKIGILDNLEINIIAEQILRRIIFLGELIGSSKLPNRLIIFLTDARKEIDDALEHQRHFRTLNINTAVTNMHDIIIYRREELYKSIFHELIHFHDLDFKRLPTELSQMALDYLHQTHNISVENEYLLYEAITESLANTLNAAYLSRGIKEFRENLASEIMFSTFQVSKILRICGFHSWDAFVMLDGKAKVNGKAWRQDSCVFSYYVLKLYVLLNLDTYWTELLDSKLKFQVSKEHISRLLEIFNHGRNNLGLKKIMDYLLLASARGSVKGKKKTKINKTLRMTCLDG
jgi:hypothetical protein